MTPSYEDRVGRELVLDGFLSPESLAEALALLEEVGDSSLRRVLVERGFLAREELERFFANRYHLEYVQLDYNQLDPSVVGSIPYPLCARFGMVPIAKDESSITVAIGDPLHYVPVEQELVSELRCSVRIVLADARAIRSCLVAQHGADAIGEDIGEFRAAPSEEPGGEGDETLDLDRTEDAGEDASAVKLLNSTVLQALERRVSDIHIEPAEHIVRVRFRMDGELHEVLELPQSALASLVTRIKVVSKMDISERRIPQDGHFNVRAQGRKVDMRVATMPTIHGERVVLRLLDKSTGPQGLDQIGMDGVTLGALRAQLEAQHGIVLVTGPTGSGKTTTLYASLRHLLRPNVNILTVEDPVEYRIDGISQIQVHEKAGLSFPRVLTGFMRQDPDVIMVGEIRDEETAHVAVRASMTGHLVLSTLHMHSAAEAVCRMVDMGVKPYLIGSTLRAVLAQRLVRRLCRHCKEEEEIAPDLVHRYQLPSNVAYRGSGCDHCAYMGHKGRIAVTELLVVDETIRRGLTTNMAAGDVRRLAAASGMRSLGETALAKVLEGEASLRDALPMIADEEQSMLESARRAMQLR